MKYLKLFESNTEQVYKDNRFKFKNFDIFNDENDCTKPDSNVKPWKEYLKNKKDWEDWGSQNFDSVQDFYKKLIRKQLGKNWVKNLINEK